MILKWTEKGIKVIHDVENIVHLLPGHNEVSSEIWESARKHCLNDIKAGRIIEVATTVKPVKLSPEEIEAGEGEKNKLVSKKLAELTADEAKTIIADTYNLETLNLWIEENDDRIIRAAIQNQIDAVNKEGQKD